MEDVMNPHPLDLVDDVEMPAGGWPSLTVLFAAWADAWDDIEYTS